MVAFFAWGLSALGVALGGGSVYRVAVPSPGVFGGGCVVVVLAVVLLGAAVFFVHE
jgi:hypothetical protein